ncbi:transposase [Flavobacterium sp.]|uniref:transposase n=1 Tax=Flavobacterium sp. TaxID=239 RepID=UPI001B4565C9|nr:transposase [Flavobacterium sp.]MBP6181442.1 transposase [Flavobacterium sp.]
MNITNEILQPDSFYHIYNRGINSCKIFESEENYLFFLEKFSKYMNTVTEVYAYCLMPNHFHFLVKIKSKSEIKDFAKVQNFDKVNSSKGLHSLDSVISKQMGKFISSYSQAYNKVTNRHGALMESPFKRKRIDSEEYLKNLIVYIHLNPLSLGINFKDYKFSSYKTLLSDAKTNLKRQKTITVFDDIENLIYCHNNPPRLDFEF